ncbi:unnamed protein product [Clavelina lepadiformis]|uniref:U3 small nucleolar RNA-associated protein 11 n=1 Tax=Clavelina lepadiformis TaxID=159417 RepID=A0ABP0GJ68_CLALP
MSFKKAQKSRQRPHRERGQIAERSSLGLLEKKVDYKNRAKVFHQRQKQLKVLRKKALTKNPDEFYFKMIHKKMQEGEHWIDNPHVNDEEKISFAQRQLIETQDLNYIGWKLQIEKRKIKKLEETLQINEKRKVKNSHIYFVDSKDQITEREISETFEVNDESEKLEKELTQRQHRVSELQCVAEKMQIQRTISGDKSNERELVKKEGKNNAAIYKWKPMRKK